jgi:ABC-type nitrate/sulfonate/bicarbonate transport system substrate-binding protein
VAATERLIDGSPDVAAAAVRAIVNTHKALRDNVALAAEVGRKLFPPSEAVLIEELIRRDLPFYDATISRTFVAGMNQFTRDMGILRGDVPYEQVVATQLAPLWAR